MTRNGISHIVVLVFVILACVTFSACFFLSSRLSSLVEALSKASQRKEKTEDNTKNLRDLYIYHVSPLVMNGLEEHKEGINLKEIKAYLEKQRQIYGVVGQDTTLENVVSKAAQDLGDLEVQLKRLQHEKDTAQMHQEKLAAAFSDIKSKKDRVIAKLKNKLEQLTFRASEEDTKYVELKDQLDIRQAELATEIPKRRKEFENKRVRLLNAISYLKQTLEELTRQEVIRRDLITIQGKIFNPDIKNGFAFIDLGQNDNLVPGLKFRTFRRDKGGARRWKGIVTVKKIFDTYSFVSISKITDLDDPLTDGDYINNVFFDPGRIKHIVLIGKFERPRFKYNRIEIKRRLERMGAKVEEEVSLRTDFALIGRDPENTDLDYNNYEIVQKIRVPVVDEKQAKEYVNCYLGN